MKKKLKTLHLSKETIATLAGGDLLTLPLTLPLPIQPGSLLEACPPITTIDTAASAAGC